MANSADPADRLRRVAREALVASTRGIDVARAEAGLRDWAAQDSAVAARLVQIETARIAYIAGELKSLGYSPTKTESLAKALYLALIGLYAARRYAPALADDTAVLDLLEQMLAAAPR